MTYQAPPPPPPGSYPPPGPPAGGPKPAFDIKSINPMDLGLLAIGLLTFIFSFMNFFKASVDTGFGKAEGHINGWHGLEWLAIILVIAATIVLALALFVPTVKLPFGVRIGILGAYAVALLITLIHLAWVPIDTGGLDNVNKGHGFAYWISLILIIAGTVLSVLRLKATGGKLPWEQGFSMNQGGHNAPPVQGGFPPPNQGYSPPPAQGYAPPPQQGYAPPPPPQNYPPQAPPPPGSYPPPQQ